MPLRRRLLSLLVVPVAALALSSCGVEEFVTEGEVEGIWVDAGSLNYQVQGSRLLEPGNQVPDQSYLAGVAEGITPPNPDEVWFAVWVRIENKTDEVVPSAEEFEIHDTDGNVFKPVAQDPNANPFVYQPLDMEPDTFVPAEDSAQALSSTQGAMMLFKIPISAYGNRPLELIIKANDAGGPPEALVSLDV